MGALFAHVLLGPLPLAIVAAHLVLDPVIVGGYPSVHGGAGASSARLVHKRGDADDGPLVAADVPHIQWATEISLRTQRHAMRNRTQRLHPEMQ